ncbi:MAG: hypothetical protein K0U98_01125 [Deltaproteobacteria bacterium]|nr:hypothetical protein [Deltaproteobacteria bacterium]
MITTLKLRLPRGPNLLVTLAFLLVVGSPSASLACVELPSHPPDVWVTGDVCENGELTVIIHDYSTFAASDEFCACALNLPGTVGNVLTAEVIDSATGLPVPGLDFMVDPDTDFGGSADWQGFATLLTTIPPGLSVDLRFQVAPLQKVPCEDAAAFLASALENPSAPGLVGTGGADENGVPIDHIGIARARLVAIEALGAGVLDQPPTGAGVHTSDVGLSQSLAENFVIAPGLDQKLGRLRFTGAYLFDNLPGVVDSFEINVYPDVGGLPGPTAIAGCHESAVVPTSRVLTGDIVDGFETYRFTVDLSGTCMLPAEGSYWLEIFDGLASGDHFSWECGSQDLVHGLPGAALAMTNPGTGWLDNDDDLSLTIETTAVLDSGLPHEALGEAILGFDARGDLLVSNLGSKGEDGVAIGLGAVESHSITFEPIAAAPQLPDWSFMRITTMGELNGMADQSIWSLYVEDIGDLWGLSLEAAAVQPGSLRVEARLAGALVDSVVFDASFQGELVRFIPEGCVIDPFVPVIPECLAIVTLAGPGLVTITGSSEVMADQIIIASVDQAGVVGSLSATLMQASEIPSFTIFEEAVQVFGRPHRALGEAALEGQGDRLSISNLGSSGEDGVRVSLDEADYALLELEPIRLQDDLDQLTLRAAGTFAGAADSALGETSLTRVGDALEVRTDYSSLGASMVRVEVWNSGALAGSTTVPSGSVGQISGRADVVGCGKLPDIWLDPPCFFWNFPGPFTFVASDSTELVGDQLRLLAADASGTVDSLSSFSLEATNLSPITILGESTLSPVIFVDGFESGDTSAWSLTAP